MAVHGEIEVERRGPAGPWAAPWECDEWDMEFARAGHHPPGLYRMLHDKRANQWYILGRYD